MVNVKITFIQLIGYYVKDKDCLHCDSSYATDKYDGKTGECITVKHFLCKSKNKIQIVTYHCNTYNNSPCTDCETGYCIDSGKCGNCSDV
ncbi:tyrosine kinase, putative [Entamoeba histolytica HM-1:IMSS-B]|uniref:Uncharacterized protein n=6 Tax=Entamoeba histolytica TaxID=5759 RepID=B1N2X0_ENTH1|nr:hypothetical protein EHI_073510 [Entamoeba histolytica HM-1:IMSS]EMD47551.1 Hypothetical protein EHI5A_105370 [Entamoeba histolytica KU27]EMH72765.1 tyrosine kinase, putative [Entamoeba histolytica HM-1:IMSS-B]EMS14915.1 hypothetical protein KM1_179890 [Entamoeba histolytica HM-3:IMSS]ENY64145.1 hypothetical protein EHI7A_178570 [Entamoeba histolytica HM-1:IMSS-A]GAT93499.1 hypothetical protein CL6EHI_073510 [Entamoeba histolytica]|eukprot:XP_001913536.1 hypothetical protein EHI_073510 [Entamoeba histolytica HM-1:IMSS]